ncbi:hypothetical protein GH714_026408 [Hevea brasiliensis]|uniref:Uncharacterized protein n=1 Tax=Hevea brasiliensis TaxID=3981 RepID=A0A6A6MFN6_HEVBR|nr:hypothetical protein GH714_026408 [Hevea brasiliensis]
MFAAMVDPWWSLLGAAIPAVIAGQAFRMKKKRAEEQRLKTARGREKSSDEIFVCERVCTSKRMLKKVGALSKDPTIDTCVTVCGVSELDACADACARTVCVNQHQVPNWNDVCLRSYRNAQQVPIPPQPLELLDPTVVTARGLTGHPSLFDIWINPTPSYEAPSRFLLRHNLDGEDNKRNRRSQQNQEDNQEEQKAGSKRRGIQAQDSKRQPLSRPFGPVANSTS